MMNVAICAIARLENPYIKEWVDYHLSIGFSHIYIYDNNREGEERISDVIDTNASDYSEKVTIIPLNHRGYVQMYAYEDCYNNMDFDWIAFIDIDEFITINPNSGFRNISEFLEARDDFDSVCLNWMCYGDNGYLQADKDYSVLRRFKKPLPYWYSFSNMRGKQPVNCHIKTIVKKNVDFKVFNPHVGQGAYTVCDAEGNPIEKSAQQPKYTFSVCYIRHYITKSIEEYMSQKIRRQAADGPAIHYSLYNFFSYNRPTFRKLDYYRKNNNGESPTWKWWLKTFVKWYCVNPILRSLK